MSADDYGGSPRAEPVGRAVAPGEGDSADAAAACRRRGWRGARARRCATSSLAATFAALLALPSSPGSSAGRCPSRGVAGASERHRAAVPAAASPRGAETDSARGHHAPGRPDGRLASPSASTLARGAWAAGALASALVRARRSGGSAACGGRPALVDGAQIAAARGADVTRGPSTCCCTSDRAPLTCGLLAAGDHAAGRRAGVERGRPAPRARARARARPPRRLGRPALARARVRPLLVPSARLDGLRRLCLEAERACDDAVLVQRRGHRVCRAVRGARAADDRPRAQPALAMAQRSDLVGARVGAARRPAAARTRRAAAAVVGDRWPRLVVRDRAAARGCAPSRRRLGHRGDRRTGQSPRAPQPSTARSTARCRSRRRSGDLARCRALLDAGANVNAALDGDGSPLIAAARKGHVAAVRLLLDRGADPNMGVAGDGNPLIMAAREGHVERRRAAARPRREHRSRRARRRERADSGERRGTSSRSCSCSSRAAPMSTRVCGRDGVRHGRDGEWRTPLSMARRERHDVVARFLVEHGAKE